MVSTVSRPTLRGSSSTGAPLLQRGYMLGTRAAARFADRTGIERWLAGRGGPVAFQLRSLLALGDVERMIPLDVPWWTYKATNEIEQFLARREATCRVFEYGAGASTLWLARRAAEVHTVEHDVRVVERLRPLVEPFGHVDLRWVPPTPRRSDSMVVSRRQGWQHGDFADYAYEIHRVGGAFDLVVVDGRARTACLHAALPHLRPDGIVVFDNAGRARYRDGIRRSGLREEQKRGWAPSLPYREVTALLRRGR